MESVVFRKEDHVLAIRCVDGRTEAPVYGVAAGNLHQLRLTGGVLAPQVGARNDKTLLPLFTEFVMDQIMVAIQLKKPVAIVVVTHADCGAAHALGLSDAKVAECLHEFVSTLVERGVTIPVFGAHDDHCPAGIARVFKNVVTANVSRWLRAEEVAA
jgi:carbonic anhydrase